ncbi:MAG TPA: TetR/AcrR family transcriptional regulator, partial [Thermomicrobiales bacterium]|nr:TetR/AcrR family transcriptional regulator [Thermomicrobiales bacterium]
MTASVSKLTSKFEHKRELILASAAQRFNERGVKGATLADVATGVGLSLKSLRYYFKRKDILVAECFLRSIETYTRLAREAAAGATPEERVRLLLAGFFELIADVRGGRRPPFLHFGDIWSLEDPNRAPVHAALSDMFRQIRALLIIDDDVLDRRAVNARAHMLLSQLFWAVVWARRYEVDQLPRVVQRMHEILVGGLAASPERLAEAAGRPPIESGDPSFHPQEAFLRVATGLINERGYRGASVDKLAAEFQVTKGFFYHHNATKDDLIVECFERTFRIMRQAQEDASRRSSAGLIRLWDATASLVRFQRSDDAPLLRTSALAAVPAELRTQMTTRMNNVTDRFSELLCDGMIAGDV